VDGRVRLCVTSSVTFDSDDLTAIVIKRNARRPLARVINLAAGISRVFTDLLLIPRDAGRYPILDEP
jgi:hypothetical protein